MITVKFLRVSWAISCHYVCSSILVDICMMMVYGGYVTIP